MASSDIPFGSEFSPAVVHLTTLLELAEAHLSDRKKLQAAIEDRFFSDHPQRRLAENTILSMQQYGLLSLTQNDYQLTGLGATLVSLRDQPGEMAKTFAQHILVNCKGLVVIECIRDLMASGIELTKLAIANELRKQGLHIPENGKHLNILRQWLDLFGALNPKHAQGGVALWEPDEQGIQRIMGLSIQDVEALAELTPEQRDFARALALLDEDHLSSNKVRDHASTLYGTVFPEGGLPQSVLHKLQEVGLITWTKTTQGRGAKPHLVSPTEKLRNELLIPTMEAVKTAIGPHYKKLVRMRLDEILRDLGSEDTSIKGIALEALSFYLTRLLDLTFVKWRYRSNQTGGTEVDVLVEGARLIFSRWQIQCKNTSQANIDDVAKEVGIATAMRTNVIMFVCNGKIGSSIHKFARTVMENTSMQIILLDHSHLEQIQASPADITAILNEQARQTMEIKRSQIQDK